MSKVWLELKYGEGRSSLTLWRLKDSQLLVAFKKKAIKDAERRVEESSALDEVVGIIDKFELEKLRSLLDLLIPNRVCPKL